MESCFASRQQVNNYLIWAIRMVNHPVSTITKMLLKDEDLLNIGGRRVKHAGLYARFSSKCEKYKTETTLGKKCLRYACMFL